MRGPWNNHREKLKNNQLIFLEALITFDIWLLMKSRWLLKKLASWFIPLLEILLFMAIGASLLLVYVSRQTEFQVVNYNNDFLSDQTAKKYLHIDDKSKSDVTNLQKELIRIKIEAIHLEKSLHKMNLHLKSIYGQQKNIGTNLADFASEAVGGLVIDTPNTVTYNKQESTQMTLLGIPIWKPNYHTPRKVIQPWTEPGECWAFHGSHGKIEIELAYAAFVDKVTLEHISASASITGMIDTAPQSFIVWGKIENRYEIIDTFIYNKNGIPSQTFKIIKPQSKGIPFKRIMLEIISNWGNPDYTCIYRFKVHGKMYNPSDDQTKKNIS